MSKRAIRFLTWFGEAAMKPYRMPEGKWGSPKVSARLAAKVRKQAIIDGTFGSFTRYKGGWDPAWDTPKSPTVRRPYKGHKSDRTRDDRFEAINRKMAEQPALLEKYRESIVAAKPKPGIQTLFKRLVAMRGGSK